MNRLLLLALIFTFVAPFAARAQFGLPADNEGVTLTYEAVVPYDPDGLPLTFSWAAQPARVYFVEGTSDLMADDWHFLPTCFFSSSYTVGSPWLKFSFSTPHYFLRLSYVEQRINIGDLGPYCDSDHDGLLDNEELIHGTHPFKNVDLDANGLPDDWETTYPANPQDPDDFATRFAAFRSDWVRGCHFFFGPKLFHLASYQPEDLARYFDGDNYDGNAKVVFTDDTLSTIASIRIYPRLLSSYGSLINEDTEVLDAEPCATYTAVIDAAHPELSGLVFSSTTVGGYTGRDLLRTFDTSLVPSGSSLPTGATVPMPYRRVVVALPGGGSELRRIPAPLAITSLPLTQISPTSFPVVVRDVEPLNGVYYMDFCNFLPYPGTLLPGSVKPDLDADGLPEATRNPSTPWNSGTRSDIFNSPATCRQWFRYPNPMTYAVTGISGDFQPSESGATYHYGYFSNGFAPHKNEVYNTATFTSEMHLTLDYTQTTRLYFASDDDGWVFINGKLISELDLGGPHTVGQVTGTVVFADLMTRLGLTASTGTCRVDIFHADRYPNPAAELRILSTDPLRPVYVYQVVADSMTNAPVTYAFALDSTTGLPKAPNGMEISATTGKVTWNLYGRKDGSGNPIVVPAGDYPVTVRVTDNLSHSDEQTFTVTVSN
jgi:fibro-slime domain-containing protein